MLKLVSNLLNMVEIKFQIYTNIYRDTQTYLQNHTKTTEEKEKKILISKIEGWQYNKTGKTRY